MLAVTTPISPPNPLLLNACSASAWTCVRVFFRPLRGTHRSTKKLDWTPVSHRSPIQLVRTLCQGCNRMKARFVLSWNWDKTESSPVLFSPFRSTCVESVPDYLKVSRTCFGRLLPSGGRGQRFKSSHLDHYIKGLRSTLSRKVGVWDRINAFLLASF